MTNRATTFLVAGMILFTFLTQTGCTAKSDNVEFQRTEKQYVIDSRSAKVSVFNKEGLFLETIGSPGAGSAHQVPLPAAVNYLLLMGKGSISGRVWNDLNGDGTSNPGEPGLAGVTVFVDTDNNGTPEPGEHSAQTDANGKFEIAGLGSGHQNVNVNTSTFPNGFKFTTSHPLPIFLARNQRYQGADFGAQEMTAKITGRVWNDSNGNGIADGGENPLSGVRVYLDLNGNRVFDFGEPSTTSGGSGTYTISFLAPGAYVVTLDGNLINPSYNPTTALPAAITLATGEVKSDVDFGFQLWTGIITGFLLDSDTTAGWARITVFIDLNGNGVYDEGEPTAITDDNGMFVFTGLSPGTYTILVLQDDLPSGYNLATVPPVTIGEGETAHADFLTEAVPAATESYVWYDSNADGVRDPGEDGIPGVQVYMDSNNNRTMDNGEQSGTTDADGKFSINNVSFGPQWIRVDGGTLPDNYILTTDKGTYYKVFIPGESLTNQTDFGYQHRLQVLHNNNYPTRIAIRADDGFYVSDAERGSVFIYDSSMAVTGELKQLAKPLGIAVDATGRLYVGSEGHHNIEIYDGNGIKLGSIGDGLVRVPNDLTFDRSGNLYVADSEAARVWVFNPDGSLTGSIGSHGTGTGQFMFPKAVAVAYRTEGSTEVGEIYVGDQMRSLVQVFDMQGNHLRSFGGPVRTGMSGLIWQGLFSSLQSLAFDQNGRLHVLDSNLDIVQIIDPVTGTYIDFYNAHLAQNLGKLNLQLDIALNSKAEVLITNAATHAVELITTIP